jgi:hypothetical protein
MNIKLKLSSGKELELTMDELKELLGYGSVQFRYVPFYQPYRWYIPYEPYKVVYTTGQLGVPQ